jgi:hypothetical protein
MVCVIRAGLNLHSKAMLRADEYAESLQWEKRGLL